VTERATKVGWIAIALFGIAWGLRYLLTEPLIFEPGGWFALDGRRILEAAMAWKAGSDPYAIDGFVYSPVAILLAIPFLMIPAALAILLWITASAVFAIVAVVRATEALTPARRGLAAGAVLLFVPTIADLVLANVTVALTVAAWWAISGRRWRSGLAFGLLAAAFPKPLVVPLGIWLLVWRPASGAAALATGAGAMLASLLFVGPSTWERFVASLFRGGGIELGFVGDYGLSAIDPVLGAVSAGIATILFLALLLRRGSAAGLAGAVSAGVLVAPYAGIYAAVPMLLALPSIAAVAPRAAIGLSFLAIVTAPWSPIAASVTLLAALRLGKASAVVGPTGQVALRLRSADP